MSLVSDALRKFRQEAAARGEKRRGVYAVTLHGPPGGGRLATGLILGAVLTLVAAIAGGGAAWWILRASSDLEPTPAVEPIVAPPVLAKAESPVVEDPRESTTSDLDDSLGQATPQPARAVGGDRGPAQPPVERQPNVPPPIEAAAAEHAARPTLAPPSAASPEDPATRAFAVVAELDGVTLTLDYIVFRAKDPFAQINGRDVRVGVRVEGFKVTRIEPDRVVLENAEGELVLLAR